MRSGTTLRMKPITNTFVLIAPDCPVSEGIAPTEKAGKPTVASLQFELLSEQPYERTHEELIFDVHVRRLGLSAREAKSRGASIRAELFAKPQACMRASPLPKKYGWGVHYD